MQRPQASAVTLDDILITKELLRRSPHLPNWQAEAQAMQLLARQMTQGANKLKTLGEIALELCLAGTVGVNLLETTADGKRFFALKPWREPWRTMLVAAHAAKKAPVVFVWNRVLPFFSPILNDITPTFREQTRRSSKG